MGSSTRREEGGDDLLHGFMPEGLALLMAFFAREEVVSKGVNTTKTGANRATETQRVNEDGLKESSRARKAPG